MSDNAVAIHGSDPYSSYGSKVGTTGTFLSFKNGEFLYGQQGQSLPLGTRLVANMPGLKIGWKRWENSKVTDDRMELLVDSPSAVPRRELGDTDDELWERDDRGQPRDPWQPTNELQLADGTGDQYIYATSSKGGIGAIGRLCKEYGRMYRQKPGMLPVIELQNNFYMHAEYGKTYYPEFPIVDWVAEDSPELPGIEQEQERNTLAQQLKQQGASQALQQQQGQRAVNPTGAAATAARPSTTTTRSPSAKPARF